MAGVLTSKKFKKVPWKDFFQQFVLLDFFFDQKYFCTWNIFTKNYLEPKYVIYPFFLAQNFVWRTFFLSKIVWPKHFLNRKMCWIVKFFKPKNAETVPSFQSSIKILLFCMTLWEIRLGGQTLSILVFCLTVQKL